ncbi:MAG: hypothetical protein H6R14_2181 [Proteobacteria bacterium]|nr:hypothetical protein [Pseudomonadota bacterium]
MNFKSLCLVFLAALTLGACSRDLTRADATPWLQSKAGTPAENISGKWSTGNGVGANWGEGNFVQDGSGFYGTLGAYYVEGTINGEHLYMALSSGKKVYYTARLNRLPDGSYAGKVAQDAIIDSAGRADDGFSLMSMRRISR